MQSSESKKVSQIFYEEFDALFHNTFLTLFDELHRYALTYVRNHDLAKDCVQHVFLKWWTNRNIIDPSKIKHYLFTGVYNHCLNEIRNSKTRVRLVNEFDYVRPAVVDFHDKVVLQELEIKIQESIANLPLQCRRIFQMSRFENKKYNEIALELNLSTKTIEVQMSKALKALRVQLSEYV